MRVLVNIIWLLLLTAIVHAQQEPISFEQLEDSMAVRPKPVVIKIVTDWCPYCRLQDRQISNSPEIQQLLRDECYFVEINAEQRTDLTLKLLDNKPAYPAWVVLDKQYAIKGTYRGMLKSKLLLRFLRSYL